MKTTPFKYALALYEATKDKNLQLIDEAVSNLAKMLQKSGQSRMLPRIIERFREIYNRENEIIEAEVISREKLEKGTKEKVGAFIRERYAAEEVIINNKIDKSIRGGIIIRVGDEVLDGSVSKQIKSLKSKLIS